MGRRHKRGRDFSSSTLSKRLRQSPPPPPALPLEDNTSSAAIAGGTISTVLVTGLPDDCSVLELKSRLEMYGPVSRTRLDSADRSATVTFRSSAAADAALSACALDGISIRSQTVEVRKVTDPLSQWRIAVKVSSSSKLLRAELPLSRHGRSNKKLNMEAAASTGGLNRPYKGREIVAYDDIF